MSGKATKRARSAMPRAERIRALTDKRFGAVRLTPENGSYLKNLDTYKAEYESQADTAPPATHYAGPDRIADRMQWVIDQVRSYPDGVKVLDIGCRTGELLWPLAQIQRFDLYGIELVQQHVDHCHSIGLRNVVQGYAEKLPWQAAFFDVIILTEILEHVIDPEVVLREAERVLKPGGVVLISVPYGPWHLGLKGDPDHHVREFDPFVLKDRGTHFVCFKQPYDAPWAQGNAVGNYVVSYRKPRVKVQPNGKVKVAKRESVLFPTPDLQTSLTVAFWLPDIGSWAPIDPTDPFAHALGGRETGTIRVAQELAQRNWQVTLFCPLKEDVAEVEGQRVRWVDVRNTKPEAVDGYDVVVSVETPSLFRKVRAQLNILHVQCSQSKPSDLVGKLDERIDHYFLLSHYQQWSMREFEPGIDADKCVIFGNGIDLGRFDAEEVERIPGRLVWSSSPDRGLFHLLRWWPTLKEHHPGLSLQVFYNIDALEMYRWDMSLRGDWARVVRMGKTLPDVDYVGPVDQMTLARAQKQAELFVYPCDPLGPTETFCVTALECAAARTPMLLSNADCLPEVFGKVALFLDLPIQDRQWVEAIGELLAHPDVAQKNVVAARALAEKQTWAAVASKWNTFLRTRLQMEGGTEATLRLAEATTYGEKVKV